MSQFYFNSLADKGLNLRAVFNVEDLPTELKKEIATNAKNAHRYNQLILLGHGGRCLWQAVNTWLKDQKSTSGNRTKINPADDPIDSFSVEITREYFENHSSVSNFELLFPLSSSSENLGQQSVVINFQALGKLAGWHNDSPLGVGINSQWGTWFAYRAIILAKANFKINEYPSQSSPCESCINKPCLSACPVSELNKDIIGIENCLECRIKKDSDCKNLCLARLACPVKKEHQYTDKQINYHYSLSLKMIERLNKIKKE